MAEFIPGRPVGSVDRSPLETFPQRKLTQTVKRVVDDAAAGDKSAQAVLIASVMLARGAIAEGVQRG